MIVKRRVVGSLFFLLFFFFSIGANAGKISIQYERPSSFKYKSIYQVLKNRHKEFYGESIQYLEGLYQWNENIDILVTECGTVDSKYLPEGNMIVICYESLFQKVFDYSEKTTTKNQFQKRVFQNVMFTFWHEVGHALMDQFEISSDAARQNLELMADEFAILSFLWRSDQKWKDVARISALHFKSKSQNQTVKKYEYHPSDEIRYQKMITLLYGFAQKSYSNLKTEVDQFEWLSVSAKEYYLERSAFWEKYLREHTERDFFNN